MGGKGHGNGLSQDLDNHRLPDGPLHSLPLAQDGVSQLRRYGLEEGKTELVLNPSPRADRLSIQNDPSAETVDEAAIVRLAEMVEHGVFGTARKEQILVEGQVGIALR